MPPPRPVPPSGSFNPSAVLAAHGHAPRLPGSRSPVCVTWELRGFFSRRKRPWDSPYRAFPFRRAVPPFDGLLLPCGSTFRLGLRRDESEFSRTVFPARRLAAPSSSPLRARKTRRISRDRELLRASDRPSTTRLREWLLRRSLVPVGLAGSWPGRPLRSFALLGSPFAREPRGTLARACARTPLSARPPGRCSPGFAPLRSFLHHGLGSGLPRGTPCELLARPAFPGRPRPVPERNAALRS